MLVLTRRKNEAIMLGDDIKITILEVEAERVKIGIDAPRATKILRAELQAEVKSVNREATRTNLKFMQNLSQANDQKQKKKPGSREESP